MGLLALGLRHDTEDSSEYFTEMHNHYGYYTGYEILELGRRLGLKEKPIRTFMTKFNTNQKNITDRICHSYMPNVTKDRATQLVESRIEAMQFIGSNF